MENIATTCVSIMTFFAVKSFPGIHLKHRILSDQRCYIQIHIYDCGETFFEYRCFLQNDTLNYIFLLTHLQELKIVITSQ